jgi:superfamily II DNA or RNA helicase
MGHKVSLEIEGYENPVSYLVDEGYLSKPTFVTLNSNPGLTLMSEDRAAIEASLDLPEGILRGLSMSHQYLSAVLSAVKGLVAEGHRRLLVFAASVEHARFVCGLVAANGIDAKVVTGETPDRERVRAITRFKDSSNDPKVLVNYGVLTTGFDAPQVTAAVIARHTRSLVLYSQMVGRAMRGPTVGGTEECTIVTVVDPALHGFGNVWEAYSNWEDVW